MTKIFFFLKCSFNETLSLLNFVGEPKLKKVTFQVCFKLVCLFVGIINFYS